MDATLRSAKKNKKHKKLSKTKQEIMDIQKELQMQQVEQNKRIREEKTAKRAALQAKQIERKQKKENLDQEKKKKKRNVVMTDEIIEELTSQPYITVLDGSRRILTCSICYPGPSLLHPDDVQKHLNSKVCECASFLLNSYPFSES